MELKYRGVSYTYNPPTVEMVPSKKVGRYRGLEWRFRNPQKLPILQPTLDLVYRGVSYHTGQTTVTPVSADTASAAPVAERAVVSQTNSTSVPRSGRSAGDWARALMMAHHGLIKKREQSLLSRAAVEVGLEVSTAQY